MIEIIVTTDQGYVQHLGVMLCSLFENNLQQRFSIHILFDFRRNKQTQKLSKFVSKYGHLLHWHPIPVNWGKDLKVDGHVTRSTYYRLLIPEVLPVTTEKVLYLDSDMIIRSPLKQLWETELGTFALGAVTDASVQKHDAFVLSSDQLYFNAGVLLINLPVWRERQIAEKATQFALENPEKIKFWDQDALNAVLVGQWRVLSQHWNQISQLFAGMDEEQALSLPLGIVHFTGSSKPWQYLSTHPLKQEYYRYLKLTPWRNFRHVETSNWHILKQSIKKFLNRIHGSEKFPVYH